MLRIERPAAFGLRLREEALRLNGGSSRRRKRERHSETAEESNCATFSVSRFPVSHFPVSHFSVSHFSVSHFSV
jgi:hypothetical protein